MNPTTSTKPTAGAIATGVVTDFFDTLGIGSFATSTTIFRRWKMVPDELIPGTLNVGHTLPTIAQAIIFIRLVPVETFTLVAMIAAAVIGAWGGAGIVSRWSRRRIQLGMGIALLVFALIAILSLANLMPGGGELMRLTGWRLAIGLTGNFVLGALMTLGIGLYAPCMILIYLLGMNPLAAFPIMMGSCAFLMPVASARFIKAARYHPGVSMGLAIGGVPASIVAGLVVKSLPLTWVRVLVVVVVVYTAIGLLRSTRQPEAGAATP